MDGRVSRRDRPKQRANVPVAAEVPRAHDVHVGEGREHLGVRPGLELRGAELQREQIGRRPAEAEPPREDQVPAQLLTRRAQLHPLMFRRLREHVIVQVELDHLGDEPHEPVELLHLVAVAKVHQLERPNLVLRSGEQRSRRLDVRRRIGRVRVRLGRGKGVRRRRRRRRLEAVRGSVHQVHR